MKKYQELIVVLGGALKKTVAGRWRTTTFSESDNFGISGDNLRVVAAYYLYKIDGKRFFLVSGGKGQYKKITGAPAVAEVLKEELIRFGVPGKQIRSETKSGNTLEQLLVLQDIIEKNEKFKAVIIVSNRHHLPRIKAFIDYYSGLAKIKQQFKTDHLKLLAAEKVLLEIDPQKWKRIIDKAYVSLAMKKRLIMERRGIKQIKNGTYSFRLYSEKYRG